MIRRPRNTPNLEARGGAEMPVLPNAAVPAAGGDPWFSHSPLFSFRFPQRVSGIECPNLSSFAGLRPSSGFGGALKALAPGSCQAENSAVTSAVPTHLRVEPAYFDWRWRGATRSGSAGVGSLGSRSAGEARPRPNGVGTTINLGQGDHQSAISQHRPC
jgi:hypothetical protein